MKTYPISGWEGLYEVTKCGQVYSVPRKVARRNNTERSVRGRWLLPNKNPQGYRYVILNRCGVGKTCLVGHLVAETFLGERGNKLVDHKDRDRSNDKLSNLRFVTDHQNAHNMSIGKRNTSGRKGVSWSSRRSHWVVQVCVFGKHIYGGSFQLLEDAAARYDEIAKDAFGKYACTNQDPQPNLITS